MAKKPLSYEALKKVWYKKIKDSGFVDIEINDNLFTTESSSAFSRKESMWSWEAKQAYYNMAENFLNDHKFDNKRDKIIWEYHAHGISIRNITATLNKAKVKTSRDTVWRVVIKLRDIMDKMYGVKRPK